MSIEAISMEDICAEAVKAAKDALVSRGVERPSVVVNFAWKEQGYDGPQTYAVGTAIPKAHRKMMRDSLLQSAEDADV